MVSLDKIVQFAKSTGYIYQGSELYGGLANTWDYGPLGSLLKRILRKLGFKSFKEKHLITFSRYIYFNE